MTSALVLKASEVAAILGVDESTVRRWVARGECPDAGLPGARLGIPRWWVDERVNAGRIDMSSPGAVVGAGDGGPAASLPAGSAGGGGSHLRSVRGAATPRSA